MWLEHWSKANNSNQIAFSFSVHTHLSDTHTPLGGFCLTCLAQTSSNKTMLSSMDCDANAYGYCGKDFKFTWTIYIKLSSLYNLETYKNHILNDLQLERTRKEIWILVIYNLYRSILYTNSILPNKKVELFEIKNHFIMYCDISDKIKDNLMIFQKYVRRLNETKYVIWYEENITLNLRLLILSERNKKNI